MTVYDGATGAFLETLADSSDGLGGETFGLNFADNGDLAFVSNGSLFHYDFAGGLLSGPLAIGGFPIGVEPGPAGGLFVAAGNNLRFVDTNDYSLGGDFLGPGGTISTLNFFHF